MLHIALLPMSTLTNWLGPSQSDRMFLLQTTKAFSEACVSCEATSSAPVSLRDLARGVAREDDDGDTKAARDAERNHVWKEAQTIRKKYVQLGVWQGRTADSLAALFAKSAAKAFEGILNEKHRAFVFSCDLVHEGDQAWKKMEPLSEELVKPVFDFLKKAQVHDSDLILLFDGGCRANRQLLEQNFGDKVHGGGGLFDWVILYKSLKTLPGKRMRKVFAASARCEQAYLRLVVPRVRLSVKDREDEFYSGDTGNTNDLNMMNVPAPSKLPRLLQSEKVRIFPDSQLPENYKSASVPLFPGFANPTHV